MAGQEDLSFFDDEEGTSSGGEALAGASAGAQYLVFSVSSGDLAVALSYVLEIVPYERVSDVPGSPAYVRGVVHLRGRVLPVVDLAVKLGRTPRPVTKRTCILILELRGEGARLPMGVVMDGLATLLEVDKNQIVAPPQFSRGSDVRFVEGLIPTERGMLPLIDVERLFGDEELSEVASVVGEEVCDPT